MCGSGASEQKAGRRALRLAAKSLHASDRHQTQSPGTGRLQAILLCPHLIRQPVYGKLRTLCNPRDRRFFRSDATHTYLCRSRSGTVDWALTHVDFAPTVRFCTYGSTLHLRFDFAPEAHFRAPNGPQVQSQPASLDPTRPSGWFMLLFEQHIVKYVHLSHEIILTWSQCDITM